MPVKPVPSTNHISQFMFYKYLLETEETELVLTSKQPVLKTNKQTNLSRMIFFSFLMFSKYSKIYVIKSFK